jgi:hypothetical protein
LFNRPEPRVTFGLMVRGLPADVAKKSSWVLPSIWGWRLRSRWSTCWAGARWDAEVLRGLADAGGALVLDDTQVIKETMAW